MNPSEQAQLGKSSVRLPRFGLGTAPLGNLFAVVEEQEADATIERALELGMRYVDTAPQYGFGIAEQRVGRVLGNHPRDSYMLSTKVGRLLRADAPPDPRGFRDGVPYYRETPPVNLRYDYSADGVRRSFEESLQRLGLDRVDIVLIHDADDFYRQALDEAFPALAQMRSEGTIGAVGAGMNQAEMLADFARNADFDCFLVAGRYTLLDQAALADLMPLCVQKNIGVIIGGVYNSGILANPRPGSTFNYDPAAQHWLERAQRLEAVCQRHDVPLKAAALQFPLAHPAVTTVLTGARSVAELDENGKMFRHEIPASLWSELRAEGLLPEEAPLPA